MIEDLRQQGTTFVVDGGDLFWKNPKLSQDLRPKIQFQAGLVARAVSMLGIDAMALGPGDMALGRELVLSLAGEHELPYVAANLTCQGDAPFPAYRIVEKDGIKLGFVGVLDDAAPVEAWDCDRTDPLDAVAKAVARMGKVDLVVALGGLDTEQAHELARKVPDVAFTITMAEQSLSGHKPVGRDQWLLANGTRGKKMGALRASIV